MAAEKRGTSVCPSLLWCVAKEKGFARVIFTPGVTVLVIEQKW